MRVLVTGASGFVGGRLVGRLEAAGHVVIGCDRDTVDVADAKSVAGVVAESRPDAVVHLAAISFVPDSLKDPDLTHRVNTLGARNLIDALERQHPAARLLLVGSGDQYARTTPGSRPRRESDPLGPTSPYARTKMQAEQLGDRAAARGLPVVRVRAFNHTGAGQSPSFVAPDFARQVAAIAAGRRPPHMRVGNLESVRDFLHVDDVIDAYLRLLDPGTPPDVYNVASGHGTAIGVLLQTLCELAGVATGVGVEGGLEVEVDPDRFRPADELVGDPGRLMDTTGWAPRIPLRDALRELLDYWEAQDGGSRAPHS